MVPDASADYFLMEEKIPLSKEKCDTKKAPQQRPLASDERVLKVQHSWQSEEGYVGRMCLKAKEEVSDDLIQILRKPVYSPQSSSSFLVYCNSWNSALNSSSRPKVLVERLITTWPLDLIFFEAHSINDISYSREFSALFSGS